MIRGFETCEHFIALVEWAPGLAPERERFMERFTMGIHECKYNLGNIAFIVKGDPATKTVESFTTWWEGREWGHGPSNYEELEERIGNWREWARRNAWRRGRRMK